MPKKGKIKKIRKRRKNLENGENGKKREIGGIRKKKNIWKKKQKSGRKGKNWEGSSTLYLLTDWAGYTTEIADSEPPVCFCFQYC